MPVAERTADDARGIDDARGGSDADRASAARPDGPERPVPATGVLLDGLRAGGGLALVLPLVLWWAVSRGGLSTALVVPGLVWLAVAAVVLRTLVPARRPAPAALVATAGLAVVAALSVWSVTWATDPGAATDAALRAAVAAGAFALVVGWPPTPRGLRALVVAVPVCALAALSAGVVDALGDPGALIDGRLSAPTGYPNATALIAVAGAGPAVVLAADRTHGVAARIALTGVAAVLLGGALLPQSRSVLLLAAPVALAVPIAAPSRVRAIAFGAWPVALVAAVAPVLLGVRTAALGGDADPARSGALALLVLLAGGAAGGGVLLSAERRGVGRAPVEAARRAAARARARLPRRRRWLVLPALVALALAGAGLASTAGDDLGALSNPDYERIETSGTRFSAGLRSNRPDYWRVAVRLTAEHPLRGVGAGNFGVRYLPLRRATTTPVAAHSTWLGTAAGLGVPGIVALVAAAAACATAAVRRLRGTSGADRSAVLAAALPALAVTLAATVDWSARVPVVALLALAPVAAVVGGGPSARGPEDGRRRARGRSAAPWAPAVLLLAVVVFGVRPFLATRGTERAVAAWRTDPAAADAELRRAARLVPRDARPVVQRGVLELAAGRWATAGATMREAARRDPAGWYPHLALAALAARAGDAATVRRELRAVDERVAGARTAARLRRDVAAGTPVDPRAVQARAFAQGP